MQLNIAKSQSKTLLRGVIFELHVNLSFTNEELEIIKTYKLGNHTLVNDHDGGLNVESVMQGHHYKFSNVIHALDAISRLQNASVDFYKLMFSCKNFTGDESFSYPVQDADDSDDDADDI
jgi:hypothetical protein